MTRVGTDADTAVMVRRALDGDRRSLARLITVIEDRGPGARRIARALMGTTRRAHVVGLTGPPGVGKSTATSALITHWRAAGSTVAVLAVDPSSPFTGGAVLGDRVRMATHSTDQGVFIRSMATRGQLGGLAAATPAAVRLLDSCGFDVVVVETVGVGQNEVDIVAHADTVAVLLAPGMGDSVQAAKAGLLEVADVLVVNKADHGGADGTALELAALARMKSEVGWRPPVLRTMATQGVGIAELADVIRSHRAHEGATGGLTERRRERALVEIRGLADEVWHERLAAGQAKSRELAELVAVGELDPYEAAGQIVNGTGLPLSMSASP